MRKEPLRALTSLFHDYIERFPHDREKFNVSDAIFWLTAFYPHVDNPQNKQLDLLATESLYDRIKGASRASLRASIYEAADGIYAVLKSQPELRKRN